MNTVSVNADDDVAAMVSAFGSGLAECKGRLSLLVRFEVDKDDAGKVEEVGDVPDLELDTGTRKILDAEKAGLWKRVDMALTDKVRRAARIDLAHEIATVRNAIAKPHQKEDLILHISVGQVRPQQVYSTAQGLITDVAIDGAAQAEGHVKIETGLHRAMAPEMQATKAPNKEAAETTLPESR